MTTIHHDAIISEKEIKDYIKKTTLKTAEFVQAVLRDACGSDGNLEDEFGKKLRFKTVKSPKSLIEFWRKHRLPVRALAFHTKKVWQNAPQKTVKTTAKKARATASTGAKRGRPRKNTAPILALPDYPQGELSLH